MVDRLTPERRSRLMSRVKGRNTGPELALRAALREAGLTGYRLHRKDLPGRPDIVYGRWRVAVFVDGAFWHGRPDRFDPDRATDFWREKIARNVERDRAADEALRTTGWIVLRFWDTDVKEDAPACAEAVGDALLASGRTHPKMAT